jgi:hypothetical protein
MTREHRERRRATFDQAADLYDRARPGYPRALFDDLAELTGVGAGSRVLESRDRHGRVRGLAAARRAVRPRPGRDGVPLDRPGGAGRQAADVLRPGGWLATISTHHIAGGDESFFAEAQTCYERWDPETPSGGVALEPAADIPHASDELDRSSRFGPARFRRYEWELPYTAASYLDLLRTYSGHRDLDPGSQAGLLGCIAHLIDSRHGGRIVKRYLTELRVAPAVQPPT